MFKNTLLASVAAIAMIGSAAAADLPSRKAPPVAYAPPVPIFTWTGFYVGVNGGGMFRARNENAYVDAYYFGGAVPVLGYTNNNNNGGRALVGGQAGVNWQISQFVLGIEGDGDAVLGNNRNSNFPGATGGSSTGFLGTVRGRAGIAFDRFLVYGTGGVAFGSNNMPNTVVAAVPGVVRGLGRINIPGYFTANGNHDSRVGYALGAGVEYAFLDNWSLKVEYLYTDLGRNNRTYYLGGGLPAGFTVNTRETNHIIRAGLNYRFNWGGAVGGPVVARY